MLELARFAAVRVIAVAVIDRRVQRGTAAPAALGPRPSIKGAGAPERQRPVAPARLAAAHRAAAGS